MSLHDLAEKLIPVVLAAGKIERDYFHAKLDVLDKLDGSPVTLADQEAEKLIAATLRDLTPDIPMVGEESVAAGIIPDITKGDYWLVDPLDGTRDFITGGGDFTVNIALLANHRPVLGIIYAPMSDVLYVGAEGYAWRSVAGKPKEMITARQPPAQGLTMIASKRADKDVLAEFTRAHKIASTMQRSSSLKFCVIAEGLADFYPRLGPTCEWDTAAGEAILNAAGGSVTNLDGTKFIYGKHDKKFLNPGFIAKGR